MRASAILLACIAPLASAQTFPQLLDLLPEEDGLVAHYWPSRYGTACDITGNGNNGALSNGTTITENGFLFDGDSWVEIGNRPMLSITNGALTITAWYNSKTNTGSTYRCICAAGKYNVDAEFSMWLEGNSKISATVSGANANSYYGKYIYPAPTTNAWHFIGMSFDPAVSTNVLFVVDGVSAVLNWNGFPVTSYSNRGARVTIGAGDNATAGFVSGGTLIDDVRFYRGAMSKDRLDKLMWRTAK